MLVIYHDDCSLHRPKYELLNGSMGPYLECADRLDRIRAALEERGAGGQHTFQVAQDHGVEALEAIHSRSYLDWLQFGYQEWVEDGGNVDGVMAECFPHRSWPMSTSGPKRPKKKDNIAAKAGWYSFDLSCTMMADTWRSAYMSAQTALTAADALLLEKGDNMDDPLSSVFALCRPPGHHACGELMGGYCFLNNAAIVAQYILDHAKIRRRPRRNTPLVVILDVDYHHGNGTSQLFYDSDEVLYISLHAKDDYPYFSGKEEEKGQGRGQGWNINIPLCKTTMKGPQDYLSALRHVISHHVHPLLSQDHHGDDDDLYLVVSLGVDTYKDDPIGGLHLDTQDYLDIGRAIAQTGVKKVCFVMEGGYVLDAIGTCVANVLNGFEQEWSGSEKDMHSSG